MSILYKYVLKGSCNVIHVRLELKSEVAYRVKYLIEVIHENTKNVIWHREKTILMGGMRKRDIYDNFYTVCNHNEVGKYKVRLTSEVVGLGIKKTSDTKQTDYYYVVDISTKGGKVYLAGVPQLPCFVIRRSGKKEKTVLKNGLELKDIVAVVVGGESVEIGDAGFKGG